MAGEVVLPVSILITLMIGRNFIDVWMRAVMKEGEALLGLFFILLMLAYPSSLIFEYGTAGLMFTVYGAFCRLRQQEPGLYQTPLNRQMFYFGWASLLVFCGMQAASMAYLNGIQFLSLFVGLAGVFLILSRFEPSGLPNITQFVPSFLMRTLKFTGRRTLEIYVVHLLGFKALALWLVPERFQFLQWQWMYPATKSLFDFIFLK